MDLATAPIRLMEPAIIGRLRLAFPANKFQIERVPPVLTDGEFRRVVRLTPFIGLAWLGAKPDPASGRQLLAAMRWRLVLIVKASSGDEARFKGDRHDIGLDAMVDVATALLQGFSFPGIGASAVTGAEGVFADGWADDATVIGTVDFEVRYTFSPAALQLVTLDDFQRLAIGWSVDGSTDPDNGPDAGQQIEP